MITRLMHAKALPNNNHLIFLFSINFHING